MLFFREKVRAKGGGGESKKNGKGKNGEMAKNR
jgi:hypothetical protein